MPTELYGILYGHNTLYVVMMMLKDIYAKKPQQTAAGAAATTTQGAAAPFTLIMPLPEALLRHKVIRL